MDKLHTRIVAARGTRGFLDPKSLHYSLMAYVIPVTNLGQKEISMYSYYSKFPEDSEKILPQA